MSVDVDFEIRGLAELEQRLLELSNEAAGRALDSALYSASKPLLDAVIAAAPVAKAPYWRYWKGGRKIGRGQTSEKNRKLVQPGGLRNAIRRKRLRDVADVDSAVTIVVRDRAFYYRFLEYGTPHMAARPFLRPAMDAHSEKVVEQFGDVLRRRIGAAERKAARDAEGDS